MPLERSNSLFTYELNEVIGDNLQKADEKTSSYIFYLSRITAGAIYAILTIILVTYYWGFTNFGATYEAGAEAYPPLWDWPMCWNVIAIVMGVSFILFLVSQCFQKVYFHNRISP